MNTPTAPAAGKRELTRTNTLAAWLVSGAAVCAPSLGADDIKGVAHPPTDSRNSHYISNREPLLASPLVKLPIGSVRGEGWLKKQVELQAAGFHGHLTEISQFLKKEKNAWLSKDGQGEYGWEEVPYWLKGFIAAAYLTDNKAQIAEATVWIEGAIASQEPSGMFGPRGHGAKSTVSSTDGPLDLWPNMVMLNCLQTYYEATGDPRVIDLVTRYFKFQMTIPEKDLFPPYWQQQRAADNLASVYWLYNHTGDTFLLDLAKRVHAHTVNWTDAIPDWHNVNMSQAFGGPATFYQQSKEARHLAAAERNWRQIREMYGQVPGGMFGSDENCRPGFADPRQAVETCGMAEMMLSCERLVSITANPVWADRAEDVAFNSLPAAIMPDFSGLRYLTAPNHVQSDKSSKAPGLQNGGNMYQMRADDHRCCQHNFGHAWPYFVQHHWMATGDNGLAAVFYSPSSVAAKVGDGTKVTITTSSNYPFDETIVYSIDPEKTAEFPMYLRVPGWCESPSVAINRGAPVSPLKDAAADSRGFIRVERMWKKGDTLTFSLPMGVRVRTWKGNHNSVSVDRGPLTYSLKIKERYQPSDGPAAFPGGEIWPESPWNYGLVLDENNPAAGFEVVKGAAPTGQSPFTQDGVPISLKARGRRIPEWKQDYLGLVGLLQDSPAKSAEPIETVTLIPMGAARLRVSAFPTASDAPNAHQWTIPPEAKNIKVSASHCYGSDTVRAVADGLVPRNSSDHSIPRLTWWDHRGTREWVEHEFDSPREVRKVLVYWFDDEPANGKCRTPKSAKVMVRVGGKWVEPQTLGPLGVAKDSFNQVTFEAVKAEGVRVEVELREGFSGGVLEIRAE
ncbi:MAG: glycoside hydrolase family 127 protein [Phycisphaerae bacterium]|nr:glycoside hydrolase family 127 protein [Phycisphaerae bacterium]